MVELQVSGMTCPHCVRAVTEAIRAQDPAAGVTIDLGSGMVQVTTTLERSTIAAAIAGEGYTVRD